MVQKVSRIFAVCQSLIHRKYKLSVLERGGVALCYVPRNRRVAGSNLPQVTASLNKLLTHNCPEGTTG